MSHKFLAFIAAMLLVLAFLFGAAASPASASMNPSSFSLVLTFIGASANDCGMGVYIGFSTAVTFEGGSHTQVVTVTDGKGYTLFTQSGPDFPDGTYGGFGSITYGHPPAQNPITATVVYDGVAYTGSADVPCLPPGPPQDVPIPAGFVLKTIVCDVAVYNQPGGGPVGSNAIKNGQTWYVNPTPVAAADGQSWTEIFVAGKINGFVPTSCVQ